MKTLIGAALALSLIGGSAALAEPANYGNDHRGQYDQRQDGRDSHNRGNDHRRDNDRADNNRGDGWRGDGWRGGYRPVYGYGHNYGAPRWVRGQRWDYGYQYGYDYRPHYVDYRYNHHLRRPPHGYRWVQDGDDFLLIALAGGLIAEIIASN